MSESSTTTRVQPPPYVEAEDVTIIRDTDIVFDCPHCGHNLAIDYRGAGLPITCTNCHESVLVPIPDGMEISDLDTNPGELLKELFSTRRNLRKSEQRTEELESKLANIHEYLKGLVELLRD